MTKHKKVRFGIIGSAGLIGNYHAGTLTKGEGPYELTALCDIDAARLAEQSNKLGVPAHADYRELLGRDDLDAVIVATPHPLHADHVIAVVESGRDVLSEKPIAHTPGDARRMLKAINRTRRIAGVHYQHRANPVYRKIKEMITSGELGRLLSIRFTGSWYKSDFYYSLGGWRGTWADEGGGTLINQAPHDIDILCYLAAEDMPAELIGRCSNLYHATSQVEDHATAAGVFPNGVEFAMNVSVAAHGDLPTFNIFGTAGMITTVAGKFAKYIRYEQDLIEFCREYDGPNPYQGPKYEQQPLPVVGEHDPTEVHKCFAQAVLTRKKSKLLVSAKEGRWSSETINAIILSSYLGKKVKLPLSPARYDKMLAELIATARPVERGQRDSQRGMEAKW